MGDGGAGVAPGEARCWSADIAVVLNRIYCKHMTNDTLNGFVDQILFERGADALPEEVQAQMKQDLTKRAEDRINAGVLAALPPEQLEAFEKIVESGSGEEIDAFTRTHVPNLEEVIGKELADFKALYLSA